MVLDVKNIKTGKTYCAIISGDKEKVFLFADGDEKDFMVTRKEYIREFEPVEK